MTPARLREAREILRSNSREDRYTVPSAHLYPYQWAWDSAFIAVGWATFDRERALVELETLFSRQWPDGRVPHIAFWADTDTYFPGPAQWGRTDTSTITNPLVFALALERVVQRWGRMSPAVTSRMGQLLRRIERAHAFVATARDPLGIGAVACAHPWESGRDNCPAWDRAMARVDIEGVDASGRTDKAKVDDAAQRPTDEAYRGYLALVAAIREGGFGMGPFAVYDPFLTALLIRSDDALLRLAERFDVETDAARRSDRAAAALHASLFDGEGYVFLDARTSETQRLPLLAALQPLAARPPPGRIEALAEAREAFRHGYAAPTVAPTAEAFDPVCYWRGPVWINMNWLHEPVLGSCVRDGALALIERSGFREYFHPETGAGLGAERFAWSAALALDWSEPL
ncbi:MAG: neutral trehalase [Myxococcota bacterium]